MRVKSTAAILSLVLVSTAAGQSGDWRFRWQTGDVLTYRVEHITSVAETLKGSRVQTTSKLNLVKRWQVLKVDEQGTATLQLSLPAMRNEQVRPDGEVLLFDSTDPDRSTPAIKEALMKFIGKPLAELRVDATGKVIEAKQESLQKYEMDPPFVVILPEAAVAAGSTWQRNYAITLAPPLGTGEQYDAVQSYLCKTSDGRQATIALKTAFKSMPESSLDQIPLYQKQPEGEIVFDLRAGRLHRAQFRIVRALQNHQGADSSYHFESNYKEEFVPAEGN